MQGIEGGPDGKTDPKKDGVIPPVNADPKKDPKLVKSPPKPALKPIPPETLPQNLQGLPIVKNQGIKKAKTKVGRGSGGDNSKKKQRTGAGFRAPFRESSSSKRPERRGARNGGGRCDRSIGFTRFR